MACKLMPIDVEWIDEPHIIQVTYHGRCRIEEVIAACQQIARFYNQYQQAPFCMVGVIMPGAFAPPDLADITTHPAFETLKRLDAIAVNGVDDAAFNRFIETLARIPDAPPTHLFDLYRESVQFVQQFVRVQQLGLV